jgi:drug/metabolite transporter (DMT)-like permease
MSRPREHLLAVALLILSASLAAAVDGLSKIPAETQSIGQIVWARYALALPVLMATTRPTAWTNLFKTAHVRGQIIRGSAPLVTSSSMVMAVRHLPLADATAILFAAPFFVVALSKPLLRERVPRASWIGVAIGFVAVLVVARPGFSRSWYYTIFPLVAASSFALMQLITRRLAAAGERTDRTLAWTLTVGCLVATPFAVLTWAPLSPTAWLLMFGLGVSFGLLQLLMIRAFALAPAAVLAPFSYAQIVAATLFGMCVFGSVPDGWSLVGIAIIIAAGLFVVRSRTE